MYNLRIISVGKLKNKHWKEIEKEFLKRLSPYAKTDLVELDEISFKSDKERDAVRNQEEKKILKKLSIDDYVVLLDELGKEFGSIKFSKWLDKKSETGQRITIIIGGPLGTSEEIKKRANETIALSQMTFTHQMTRIFLLEQLYRAATISRGKRYHY